jgi:hypothetical protein
MGEPSKESYYVPYTVKLPPVSLYFKSHNYIMFPVPVFLSIIRLNFELWLHTQNFTKTFMRYLHNDVKWNNGVLVIY